MLSKGSVKAVMNVQKDFSAVQTNALINALLLYAEKGKSVKKGNAE